MQVKTNKVVIDAASACGRSGVRSHKGLVTG